MLHFEGSFRSACLVSAANVTPIQSIYRRGLYRRRTIAGKGEAGDSSLRNSYRPDIMTAILAGILELFTDREIISYGEEYTDRALQAEYNYTADKLIFKGNYEKD